MAAIHLVASFLILSCFAASCHGLTLKDLKKSLIVTAVPNEPLLKAGDGNITVKWDLDEKIDGGLNYAKLKFKLCYIKESQKERKWRTTVVDLKKDKTCQFDIVVQAYVKSGTATEVIKKEVPTAKYFVRAYAYDAHGTQVAYGDNTEDQTKNIFNIESISGRHTTLDICSVAFSTFSIVALFGFFFREKRNAKRAAAAEQN